MKKIIDADDNELMNKLVELTTQYENKKSELDIKYLIVKIKKYRSLINVLKEHKPFFFQKKKIYIYNNKLSEYNNEIYKLYNEIELELNLINKINN